MSIFPVKKYTPQLAENLKVSAEAAEETVLKKSREALLAKPVTIRNLRDEFRIVEEGENKTIVVTCDAGNIQEFSDGMSKSLGRDISLQPTHITLYIRENGRGIGLTDEKDLKELSRTLSDEEKQVVRKSFGAKIWK